MSPIATLLKTALQYHQSGMLVEAETLYQQIIQQQPNHGDALHLLGMVRHQQQRGDEAEKLIERAILIQPRQAVYHSNLGLVLAANGKTQAAIEAYRNATRLDPTSAEALNNLAVALCGAQEIDEAIDCLKQSIVLKPDYADARLNLMRVLGVAPDSAKAFHLLGDLYHAANKPTNAIAWYRKAIELDPHSVETHNNLGNALHATGDRDSALECFERALQINPEFPQACNNLANVLSEAQRFPEAIAAYKKAVELQPGLPEPLSNLGNLYRDTGAWELAMACYRDALAIDPQHAVTHNNIGNAHCERCDWSAAIEFYERAIAINGNYSDAINNLGTALEETGQRDQAMDCYRQAAALDPSAVSPPWNIALLQLLQGDYQNGWNGYERRWQQKIQSRARRDFTEPMLTALSQCKGRRILLHAEQGFGDAIQFCRYAPMLCDLGAQVMLECPLSLVRLFQSLRGVQSVIARGDTLPGFDLHCPLMSLPMLFGTTVESVPASVPYLSAGEDIIQKWACRFNADRTSSTDFHVGLVWAGHSIHQKDFARSIQLSQLAELGKITGVQFHSLQAGAPASQATSSSLGMVINDWSKDLNDFAATAGLISQLDLVIAVDTAVAHLAGAMGKPTWILLAYHPDWRWLLDRSDSPWYPTARLFRQRVRGDWCELIERLAGMLNLAVTHRARQRQQVR